MVKSLRPQPLPEKMLAIALAANVPLGVWREHTIKFSPSWFEAVHSDAKEISVDAENCHGFDHWSFHLGTGHWFKSSTVPPSQSVSCEHSC